ncbi:MULTISPECIES: Bug family tripartite tricarboxylate transporter substrate binding protein [Cupriavidus]|uniref:Tripartite-type tricarboxylate transporter receptor subunit TctC n=1 Tax=Cupriavidus alkaliphilus TaxID=942866 RepID=A0A7W4VFJ9_9BURK|nr:MULTISPECIES: tripartite tricarboxylate transporter substrate binding protein [Cupriavidus]MBB3009970.1 tripartite-type tricarboxylate transporter receptor subunit TctC [Cupriavidus alkaliphilus]GLC97243.1 MFS transporter [Cupriavidus sp. TA19]
MNRTLPLLASFALMALPMLSHGKTDTYPTRPIRVVVPFSAASSADNLARALSEKLSEKLKQPLVIDNRVGAGGTLGVSAVAKAPPDGYTLLLTTSSPLVISPLIDRSVQYNVEKDLAPVAMLSTGPLLLVSSPNLPARNVQELIALLKKEPGKYSYASNGNGSYSHMAMELFARMAGVDLVHIPYKGPAQAEADVIGGQVTLMFDAVGTATSMIRAGRLRSYGTSSAQPDPLTPDQTPLAAQGGAALKGFDVFGWSGLLAPAGTPPSVIATLQTAVGEVLADAAFRELMAGRNTTLVKPQASREMAKQIRGDRAKWEQLVKSAGIKLE